ncbi:MAG: Na+/H+ antiporter NhaC family protein [Sedimentisphaerales bacterium]|nr:Na+/H+ antiporter NhaC family protein [Sedimentisphaerales bacterium]
MKYKSILPKTITQHRIASITILLVCLAVFISFIISIEEVQVEQGLWYSIIPPFLAIVLAIVTRHVFFSLCIAITVGSLLLFIPSQPINPQAWLHGITTFGMTLRNTALDGDNLKVLAFLPLIFTLVELMIAFGGFAGIMLWLLKRVRTRKSVQAATAGLGVLCFIDDYANAIIVGSMMQPVTDRYRISREKLAFLVDATSAPIAGLAVVSTWIAYEVGLFNDVADKLELTTTGYAMFFDALPYRFYCWLMIAFVFAHIFMSRDFGPMKTAEFRAREIASEDRSECHDSTTENTDKTFGKPLARNAIIPLAGFLMFHFAGLWIDGGGPEKLTGITALINWEYWRQVISDATHSTEMLAYSAGFGIVLALVLGWHSRSIHFCTVGRCILRGIRRALLPAGILILAWSLKETCGSLKTGSFLASVLQDRIPPMLFGPALFIVASMTSFATGTSYGTMGILIPIAIPVAFVLDGNHYGPTTVISLAAVLDGAIFGDHCSPISDTTILSATASNCDLVAHVRTQLPYSLFIAALALTVAYLPASFGLPSLICIIIGILIVIGILLIPRKTDNGTGQCRC